ncbi:MAG: hypothetical protein JW969_08200 [Spirochaetales bacterium]|nr:hypothetical protein [Spirochaetales bacterium]
MDELYSHYPIRTTVKCDKDIHAVMECLPVTPAYKILRVKNIIETRDFNGF